jgi:hypothetical protein
MGFREVSAFQPDIVPMAEKHTTIYGKKSSRDINFL